jgi:hypothetical protein
MKKLLLFALLLISAYSFSQQTEKYQRAKIIYNAPNGLQTLESLGIPVEHGIHKRGYSIISEFSETELEKARSAGFQVDVIIDDAKQYFLDQNNLNKSPINRNPSCSNQNTTDYQTPANFNLGSMGGYLTYQEMLNELDQMKTLYPNLITAKTGIGSFLTEGTTDNSVTPSIGNNPIMWVKISDNPNNSSEGEPQILYTAIHHAREPASLSQLIFYMWYLLENYDSNPEIKAIVDNTELYFVPVVNPDGYLYNQKTDPNGGGFWRKNRKNSTGVDNNRNYDYYIGGDPSNNVWGGQGTSTDPNNNTYAGTGPFSEIENQAIKWFCEQHNFVMAFNNHTYGDLLLFPYGFTDNFPTPENTLFENISEELVSQNGFNNMISSGLYPAAGDSDDFMYGTVGTHDKIYAFTPEIGNSFWPPSNQIENICKNMMYLNLTAAKMVNNYATVRETSSTYVGENALIDSPFTLKRLGINGTGNFTVSIQGITPNIVAVGNPVNISGLNPLEEITGNLQYTLASGTSAGDDIIYKLIVNNGSYDNEFTVYKKFGALSPIFEDTGNSTSVNFNNNGWGTTSSTYVSPSSSITDSPNGNYTNNSTKTITTATNIDLTNAIGANLSFYAKWDIENDYDYVQLQISTDNGNNWVAQCGNYTNLGSNTGTQPQGEPLYDGTQTAWVLEEIDLSDYLGSQILIRFRLNSDNFQTGDGFYFDDLKVQIVSPSQLGINDVLDDSFSVYPNPIKDQVTILSALDSYNIAIYNLQGQLVYENNTVSGTKNIALNQLTSGLYILKLTTQQASKTIKLIKQ